MNDFFKITILLFCLLGGFLVRAQHVAVFCGGEMYQNIEQNAGTFKLSGFNTIIFWSVHVMPNGDFILNDSKIIADGDYVGKENWLVEVNKLKVQPTSVNRIEFSVGAWGVPDFENIEELIKKEGTGENSILYRNFKKLKEITGADAIDYDDESNYDVSSTVQLSEMLIQLGFKITLCPYKQKNFWQSVYNQVQAKHPDAIDRIYLQCYAGGAANTPSAWNNLFEGLKVSPGLWCSHGNGCTEGLDWRSVKNKLNSWKSEIEGGFIWVFDDILQCSIGGTPENYAKAIRDVMGIEVVAPGKAFQPKPANSLKDISVDKNLGWVPGSWDAKHKIYFGTDSIFTESDLKGTFDKAEYEPGTLKNNATYYWRIDEFNDAGTVTGDVWSFTTEIVTLPAEKASLPKPLNQSENIDIRTSLSWTSGKGHITHKVYFGVENPPPFIKEQTDTFYIHGKLEAKTTYYWRIDEKNSSGATEGNIWSFTTRGKNIAPEAEVSVSSEYTDSNYEKNKAVDGIVGINAKGEWASNGETTPWLKLNWTEERNIVKIILYDRPNSVDVIEKGTLTFSDGSAVEVGPLPNEGEALEISFPTKKVSWVKFEVTSGGGSNVGLSEIEVIESDLSVGVLPQENNKFLVYPNPSASGIFYFNIPSQDLFQLQVFNEIGELVKSIGQVKNNDLININYLPNGLYVLKLWSDNKEFVSKILY